MRYFSFYMFESISSFGIYQFSACYNLTKGGEGATVTSLKFKDICNRFLRNFGRFRRQGASY